MIPIPSDVDILIYHKNCTDGYAACYAGWKLLGNKARYIACSHGDPPPDVVDKNVAICDFSFDNKTIKQMISDSKSLVVLDHHKSAMIELHDIVEAQFDMNHSGAILSWNFFHPGKEPPKFLLYVQDRDLWAWELPYSREFSKAFDMCPFEFEEFEKFEDESVFDNAIKRGSYILAYSKTVIKKICDRASRKKLDEYSVLVVNSSHWMSEIGAKLSTECDIALIWFWDHELQQTVVSLRSFHDSIDVSEVAKRFGGGGHKKAAGFKLDRNSHIEDLFDTTSTYETLSDVVMKSIEEDLDNIAKKAEKAGVIIDDEAFKNAIKQASEGVLSGSTGLG